MIRIKTEGLEHVFLSCSDRVVKSIDAVHLSDHLDLLQFFDRGRDGHVVRPCHILFHRILELAVDFVADDEGDELDEDLSRNRLIRTDPEAPVAQIGLVPSEQLFALVPALVEVQSLLCAYLRRSDDDEVPAQAELTLDHIRLLLCEKEQVLLLVVDKIEVVVEGLGEGRVLHLIGGDELRHAVHHGPDLLLLGTVLRTAVVDVEIPVLLV